MGSEEARAAAENAARESYGRLVAYLAACSRDVAGAEDALADAFAAALEQWPSAGVPGNPAAWLLTVARRRQADAARRRQTQERGSRHVRLLAGEMAEATMDHDIPDERLKLMFACAHPAIGEDIRAPLILQTVLGLDAATIAAAFLVPSATMGQRLVRAKAKIRDAGIPFAVPGREALAERLDAVLQAIYAAYSAGWSDPAAIDLKRRSLAGEGLWLGRVVAGLMPAEPEALGLLALMLFAEARRGARRSKEGAFVPLGAQDTALWDEAMIDEAEALLLCASRLGKLGRYQTEAAIQSAHIVRRQRGAADWAAISGLYEVLMAISPSPVVAVNRAVALPEYKDVAAGLAELDAVGDDGRLLRYQPYWAARAELCARSGAVAAARKAYDRAIELEADPALRAFLRERRQRLLQ